MMTLTEKIAYIKGLADGMKLDENKDEVKLIKALIDALDEAALTIEENVEIIDEMQEQLDAVDEDLEDLENYVFEIDDDECGCGCCDDEDDYFEVECPNCGETICVDESILEDGGIECPNCHESLEFEFDDECDCGCCDDE